MLFEPDLSKTAYAHLSEAVLITDESGRILFASPNAADVLACTEEAISDRSTIQELLGGLLVAGEDLETHPESDGILLPDVARHGTPSGLSARVKRIAAGQGTRLYIFRQQTAETQAQAAPPTHRQRLEALWRIASQANSSLQLDEVLERILRGTLEASAASVGMIFLLNPATGLLSWAASMGLSDRFVAEYHDRHIRLGEGLTGTIARDGNPIYIPRDASHDPRIARPVAIAEGLNSFIGVPITTAGKTVGVMNILTRPPATLSEDDVSLVGAIGAQVGSAIANARLFEERNHAVEALLVSEAQYRTITDTARDAIIALDDAGRISFCNPATEAIFGYQNGELIGRDLPSLLAPNLVADEVLRGLDLFAKSGEFPLAANHLELTAVKKDGSKIPVELSVSAIRTDTGWSAIVVGHDISQRKKSETAQQRAYDDLEYRVQKRTSELAQANTELMAEILARKATEEELRQRERELFIRNRIAHLFLTVCGNEMYGKVLQVLLENLHSELGVFGYLDENGNMRCPSITTEVWGRCRLPGKDIVFPKSQWKGIWGEVLLSRETRCVNSPLAVPEGHIPIRNWLGVPILLQKKLIGTLQVANKQTPYDDDDRRLLESIASHIAPVLNEILRRNTEERNRKQAQQALADLNEEFLLAKEAAEAASQAKSKFLATMSHEIRTPLNGVIGCTEIMLGMAPLPKEQNFLEMINSSAHRLLNIVNDILDFSKIEAGKLDLERTAFPLRKTLDSTLRLLRVKAQEKALRLSWQIDEEIPEHLSGDPGRLTQVVINLVGNAIKFTSQGEITLTATVQQKETDSILLRFAVQDTGIGIDPAKASEIFKPFSQADGSFSRRYGGTGLGLAICSQLVGMMDGKIWLDSPPPSASGRDEEPGNSKNSGAVFCFTARLGIAASPPKESETPGARALATTFAAVNNDLHILLVEDEAVNRILATEIVKQQGWRVTAAENGRAALETLPKHDFHLILMDVQMPEMDGFETTAAIRELEKETGQHIPIVALTAHAIKGDRERCLAAGMDDYLSKPIKYEELAQVVARQFTDTTPS